MAEEREDFRNYVSSQNDILRSDGFSLEIVQWEYFLDHVSYSGKQAEYNAAIRECDMVVCLFHRKAGKFTVEEFDTALGHYREHGRPLIYTYFKGKREDLTEAAEADAEVANLLRFRERLESIGHYYTQFDNKDGLCLHFRTQLDLLQKRGLFLPANLDGTVFRNSRSDSDPDIHQGRIFWVKNLRNDLLKHGVVVGDTAEKVSQHYGWLVQTFLVKLCTKVGSGRDARRLSFMAEAFQNSLRYLCCIQASQVLSGAASRSPMPVLSQFLNMRGDEFLTFDYDKLLFETTEALPDGGFVPEIKKLTRMLTDPEDDLSGAFNFMKYQRQMLLDNKIPPNEDIGILLDQYLTALIYWLRKISFLSLYRLVSVKDINLLYRSGQERTESKYKHTFGELHGVFTEGRNWKEQEVTNNFTFSQSVLLVRGGDIKMSLERGDNGMLSLSPLLTDKSVVFEENKHTPELYYYIGRDERSSCRFAHYSNELSTREHDAVKSNHFIEVKHNNEDKPLLDELYEYITNVFQPYKRVAR
jgi:hypothetical protein